jgi:hypothetical protein
MPQSDFLVRSMPRTSNRKISRGLIPLSVCALAQAARAVDIQGVLPAALDMPQTHLVVRQNPTDPPIIGQDILGDPSYDIQSFLDTGTSTIVLSNEVMQSFGLNADTFNGTEIQYNDIGIGGSTAFNVSTPYYVSLAPFSSDNDVEFGGSTPDISTYTTNLGLIRAELTPTPADDPSDQLNIAGMPAMEGRVTVLDLRPVNNLDEEHTYLYAPGTPLNSSTLDTDPGIPQTQYHVKLSFASFDQFTTVTPAGAPTPNTAANPFIGPNPLRQLQSNPAPDNTPPISISYNGHTSTGSFLLDTGADVSFLSTAEAAKMHVEYATDSHGNQLLDSNGDPYLVSTDDGATMIPNQFVVPIQGTGGEVDATGFYLDSLTIPTIEGEPLNFVDAPIVVLDITVQDPNTGKTLTLDGDLGMNFLTASLDLDSFDINGGAFDWATFDQPNGLLGLTLTGDEPIEIATGSTITAVSDSAIGDTSLTLAFTGGKLAVMTSFTSTRPMEVGAAGGTIDAATGATLLLNSPSLSWMGGTLNTTDHGNVTFALSGASVYVIPGSTLNINADSTVFVAGSTDPFTDSITNSNHVAIVNNGVFIVNANSSIAGMTGAGALGIGVGSTGHTLQLAPGSGLSTVSSLTINTGSTLDLTNNHLIINYAGTPDPIATIRQYLISGYNNGTWTGPGISSSSAAAASSYALGYADGADGVVPGLSSGQIEIKYTLYGDANLDGVVNGNDFTILAAHLGKAAKGWDQGDFTYAGVVNGLDFTMLVAHFGKAANGASVELAPADWTAIDAFAAANGLMADVPEPASGAIVFIIGAGLVRRRARRA